MGEPVNEYGVPLHACNGYRHDEHYWAYVLAVRVPLLPPNVSNPPPRSAALE